jgi:dihydrofolate reductase
MAKLIYSAITSLDGYIEDRDGKFDWGEPIEEEHRFINDLLRSVGTHLYGRRMYQVMQVWETPEPGWPPYMQDFATIWQAADKIVYSRTLAGASTARTRIERAFDSEPIRQLKSAAVSDILVAGPELAAQAILAGLVDEFDVFVAPVVLGGGKPWLPKDVRLDLDLLDQRRFDNGAVFLRYRAESTVN